ncbi:hypothetical protein [uncultured Psychroserpens sp.]|uniref:hypothetical protein n=1 Tax=uncultured Psychroserpens sp. TaxID=255436 RepID=UPI0026078417|nr:hypothetical protein [uncultured Psychroserpens sp.]
MKHILIVIIFLTATLSFAQTDCQKFKIGNFQNVEDGVVAAKLKRNDSIQIEEYGPIKVKLKINWIDDCNYKLIFVEGNEAFWNSRPKDKPTPDLFVRIIEVKERSYIQEARFEHEKAFNYKSEIFRVED